MTQSQAVIETIDKLGGIATLNQINCHVFEVEDCVWKTKKPFVSVRRIVQQTKGIYKIRHFCYMYLLFFCLILLYVPNSVHAQIAPATAAVVDDTCYVTYKGDSLLVVVTTSKFSDGDQISFDVSLVDHPFRSSRQMIPLGVIEMDGLAMSEKRELQKDHYVRMHKDYLYQYVDSIIGSLLPVGTETKIRGSYPYAFRNLWLDIDSDGYIIAAELYIRHPMQFILFGGVQGCGDIVRVFIGKRLPTQQLPTIGYGLQLRIPIFLNERKQEED